ncbi:MAG: TonB-dependent receptor [Acidobacteriaceae bacterium]|nr:TonB-dependent receptor [Acidobacteriaceae bacterium]
MLWSTNLFAQVDRATVTGLVRDTTGAAVSGSTILVTYPSTGQTREALSNDRGDYFIAGLPIGIVGIDVVLNGFRPVHVDTDLKVGETRTLDVTLEVAGVEATVEVVSPAVLVRNSAAIGAVIENREIGQLPINGRNWGTLMTLVPGAVDTGAGNGSSVRFVGHGGDDNNFRIDGVDATSVRNQSQSKSRLLLSTDAISEFRVTSSLYSAESGGSSGGQIEIATKSGSNTLHGSGFEYFRNSRLDARSPFDGATVPDFNLNQFGGTLGGALLHDRTFFFFSYEGLQQRQGRTQIGFVPSPAFRASVAPALQPILDAYPQGQIPVNASVMQWTGVAYATQNEHVGLVRIDHRFSDTLSSYVRVSKNSTKIFSPSGTLPFGTYNPDAPTSAVVDLLYLPSSRTINELKIGTNYSEPLNSTSTGGTDIAISVPSFSPIPAQTFRVAIGRTQSVVEQWTSFRGAHTLKAGFDLRHVQMQIHDGANAQAGTLTYASLADFQANQINTVEYSAELPMKDLRKLQYFGYVQDEWHMSSSLSANLGLRYEYYGVFTETQNRAIPFDINICGGYCPPGTPFSYPDRNNFAPRVSLSWAPDALQGRTVINAGAGIYYGDAQLGDQYTPANNDTQRFTLSQATTPGLAFPIDSLLSTSTALATAPRAMPLDKQNEQSQQWGVSVQHAITQRLSVMAGYTGQLNNHVFSRTYVNVIDPVTGQRPLPQFDQIDVRSADGHSRFNGMTLTMRLNNWHGLSDTTNYMLSHATDDGSSGGGGAGYPQNVACTSCEWADSSIDSRHVFTSYLTYDMPFARDNTFLGGWQIAGILTGHTGMPINVTVTRRATDMPDGNTLSAQRPDLVPGVPLYLDYATTGLWLNPAAFAVPAPGTWGNLPRNAVRGPGLFQVDTALTKRVATAGRTHIEIGWQIFNLLNRPQLGTPNTNISSASFGRITTTANSSPVGAGTPRQMQLMTRVTF